MIECSFFGIITRPRTKLTGWTKWEGQLLSIAETSALFSLGRNEYGGDGRSIFAITDLRNTTTKPYYIYTTTDVGHTQ